MRTYEIVKTASGWKLTMYEDGQEAGGGFGGPDDYEFLEDQALEFCADQQGEECQNGT